jgi:hypothetical protein
VFDVEIFIITAENQFHHSRCSISSAVSSLLHTVTILRTYEFTDGLKAALVVPMIIEHEQP